MYRITEETAIAAADRFMAVEIAENYYPAFSSLEEFVRTLDRLFSQY